MGFWCLEGSDAKDYDESHRETGYIIILALKRLSTINSGVFPNQTKTYMYKFTAYIQKYVLFLHLVLL
jgi:hypothetical protein